MTLDGTDVIVNGEAVHVSETVGGGTVPSVVESESVDENGESVSVIFDGATALVSNLANLALLIFIAPSSAPC